VCQAACRAWLAEASAPRAHQERHGAFQSYPGGGGWIASGRRSRRFRLIGNGECAEPRSGGAGLAGMRAPEGYSTTTVPLNAVVAVPPRLWITIIRYVPASTPVIVPW